MRFANATLGAAGIILVAAIGHWLADWSGAMAGFVGFAVGGFVASTQMLGRLRDMRR